MAHESASVSAKEAARRDAVEAREFLRLLIRQWRWALATFVIVALIAIVPLSRVKPQWEAQATVRIGTVYDALAGAARSIEPLQDLLERLRVKSQVAGSSSDAAVRFDPVPSTGLIRIAVRGTNADEAGHLATAIFNQLRSMHEELARAARSETELLAEEYAKELVTLREVQSNLQKAFTSASNPGVDDRSMTLATIALSMQRNAKEIREIDRQRFLLIRRDKYQSSPTEMIGAVSSVRIGGAGRGLIAIFGIVMGLAVGLMVALLRDYVSRMRPQRLSA